MFAHRILAMTLLPWVLAGSVLASEEEFLPWDEIRIAFPQREDVGKVVLVANTTGGKYDELKIEAFGKKHTLQPADLDLLKDFPLSSLVTTHEAGYPKLGGHTIYFKLKRVEYDEHKQLLERRVTVAVSKEKGIVVMGPTSRLVAPPGN